MVTNYVAATRGSFVQKNLPFVWKNKEICSALPQVESRDGVKICVTLTKILYKPLVIDKKEKMDTRNDIPRTDLCLQYSNTHNKE